MPKNNLDVAIFKGKRLMKKSCDTFHDFYHAKNVERLASEIFKDQQKEELAAGLISIAVYWHDVYKTSKKGFCLSNIDGEAGALIAKKKLKKILSKEDLRKVLEAIASHDQIIKYILFPRAFSFLSKILIEADMLDMFNINRWKRGVCVQNMTYAQKFFFSLFEIVCITLIVPRTFTFNKGREIYKKESKKFWNFFLFKERYFFRVIANRV